MATNLFTAAKTVPAKQTKAKAETPTVQIEGLETYAKLDMLEKAIKALKETYKGVVETHMTDEFVMVGSARKARPENFKGSEGKATASMQLRERSSASALTEDDQAILAKYGISFKKVDTTTETFIINPEYKDDQNLLQKVSAALAKVGGLPSDFIMLQQGASKVITTETSLDETFKLPAKAIREVLPIVGTLAVRPTIKGVKTSEVFSDLAALVASTEDGDDE